MNDHFVYRVYDADGALLYIGMTYSVEVRLQQHRYSAPWFPQVARVESETFTDRRSAYEAERAAIRSESPRFNVRAQ